MALDAGNVFRRSTGAGKSLSFDKRSDHMPPSKLYKYEPFSAQSIENLKNQVIYFGSPNRFNDPYDCGLFPTIKEPTEAEVEAIRAHYLRKNLPLPTHREFEVSSVGRLREIFLRIGRETIDGELTRFMAEKGVSCFCERSDNLLMWSHYGDHHRGFCLEFRTDLEPFEKIRQVKYSSQMPACDLVRILCNDDFEQILDLFCTKAIDWQYEREWRCMHQIAGTAYVYPADALTGVYFGPRASFTSLEVVSLILKGQNEGVQLWRGSRSQTTFEVIFEPVTYTSHLDVKRRGHDMEAGLA